MGIPFFPGDAVIAPGFEAPHRSPRPRLGSSLPIEGSQVRRQRKNSGVGSSELAEETLQERTTANAPRIEHANTMTLFLGATLLCAFWLIEAGLFLFSYKLYSRS